MAMTAPNGKPIKLKYERHVEHADGNWTWIGRPVGAPDGSEAILTFGKDAVYGSIPNGDGQLPLQVTTSGGKTWVIETDQRLLGPEVAANNSDFMMAPDGAAMKALVAQAAQKKAAVAGSQVKPLAASASPRMASAPTKAASPAKASATASSTSAGTIDLVIGYTPGFAARLGGQSQARTRLAFMVDVANQAYGNSEVTGQLRVVKSMQVNYSETTTNKAALLALSGVNCSTVPAGQLHLPDGDVSCTSANVPAELQPLLQAREQFHADLVSLVRTFQSPEQQSCGVAWVVGGGQTSINSSSARYGLSVVSDSSGMQFPDPDNGATCRDETLAHELGHNMGLVHDRVSAAGSDDTNSDGDPLDPNEYGRYPYSFGYSTDVSGGNFYTIMSLRQGNQTGFRVFSNPRVTYCGGLPCGADGVADNARTLDQTMPAIARFRATSAPWLRGDINGDGRSDVVWRNTRSGRDSIWSSANSATPLAMSTVPNLAWEVVGASDFTGDQQADVLWHNLSNGAMSLWRSGSSASTQAVSALAADWSIAGAGDFDGDGRSDLLLRNLVTGANVIWKSANSATPMAVTTLGSQAWMVAGVGDFDGDHKADILWHNGNTGENAIWKSANSATAVVVKTTSLDAVVAGVGDFNADGKADILWRNVTTGGSGIWLSGNYATTQAVTGINNPAWVVAGIGDFDGDLRADILWRNTSTGQDVIWKAANSATAQVITRVSDLDWSIVG